MFHHLMTQVSTSSTMNWRDCDVTGGVATSPIIICAANTKGLIVFGVTSTCLQQVVHGAFIEPEHRIRKRSINQQLRISLVYDLSVYRLDDDKFALVNVSEIILFC